MLYGKSENHKIPLSLASRVCWILQPLSPSKVFIVTERSLQLIYYTSLIIPCFAETSYLSMDDQVQENEL